MELSIEDSLNNGIEAHKAGQIQKADNYYTSILCSNTRHPDANHNKGVLLAGTGRVQEALSFFKKALEANFGVVQYWHSYVETLFKLGHCNEAKEVLAQARELVAKSAGLDELEKWIEQQTLLDENKIFFEQKYSKTWKSMGIEKALRLAKRNSK